MCSMNKAGMEPGATFSPHSNKPAVKPSEFFIFPNLSSSVALTQGHWPRRALAFSFLYFKDVGNVPKGTGNTVTGI